MRNEKTRPGDTRTTGIPNDTRDIGISVTRTSRGVRARAPRTLAVTAGAPAAVLAALLTAGPAMAASSAAYGQWSVAGQSGTLTVPAPGFPTAHVTTTSSSVQIPSGASSFLNAATPFGAAFGSSQGKPYLVLRTAPGLAPSTTVLNFATPPTPGKWGFALGDIDADLVEISATNPSGNPVPIADLGFQSTFNYCTASPLPSACAGSTSADQPTWNPGTGTLTGNIVDTNSASGWFRPRVPIKSLSLRFAMRAGIPIYQLWVAAEASQSPTAPPAPQAPPTSKPKPPALAPASATEPVTPTTIVDEGSPTVIVIPAELDHHRPVDITNPPHHGTLTHLANGNLLYTPDPEYTGPDAFTYRSRTPTGRPVTKTVHLNIAATLATTGAGQTLPLLELGGALLTTGTTLATIPKLRTTHNARQE